MNRRGKVYYNDKFAGIISETDEGYLFDYNDEYVANSDNKAISLTMPLIQNQYKSKTMFPFFDGIIPEGWLLNIAVENWKLNPSDRMGLLLSVCKDCIGAVSIIPIEEESDE